MSTATSANRSVTISGRTVCAVGQGTWNMGDKPGARQTELGALRRGVDLGLTLIDTAEMYGDGRSESLVGEAIAGRRDEVFLTSKVLPTNASRTGTIAACERSLKRLGTDHLELYLLHWPGSHPLPGTVAAFEDLLRQGKILSWGVSNFDVADLEALYAIHGGGQCAANQILYNPEYRGPEFDLLPWCFAVPETGGLKLPVMAYSPVGQGGELLQNPALGAVAARHGAAPAQVALAWELRQHNLCVIPKAGTAQHVEQNAAALSLHLTPEDLEEIDHAHPAPARKVPLAVL